MTNICSEITLHTDESHSFVCCLSSLNLSKYDEWRDTDLIYTQLGFWMVWFQSLFRNQNMRGL